MKHGLFLLLLCHWIVHCFAQTKPSLQKSWIKTATENLSSTPIEPDTLYTRYTFGKGTVKFSFYPGWDDYQQPFSRNDMNLVVGFDTYRIEELTDTSLIIALDGFRRFRFLSETYLNSKDEHLQAMEDYGGLPLYRANRYITPRYKKAGLRDQIQKKLEGYHGGNAAYFLATFVVTTEGKVENVQVVRSISEGFDTAFTKELLKTSKDWQPATFKGQPVQTLMTYEIKYLKSLVPYHSGRLN